MVEPAALEVQSAGQYKSVLLAVKVQPVLMVVQLCAPLRLHPQLTVLVRCEPLYCHDFVGVVSLGPLDCRQILSEIY